MRATLTLRVESLICLRNRPLGRFFGCQEISGKGKPAVKRSGATWLDWGLSCGLVGSDDAFESDVHNLMKLAVGHLVWFVVEDQAHGIAADALDRERLALLAAKHAVVPVLDDVSLIE